MSVQGHAVHALTRNMLDADRVAALATPTNPVSAASLSKVDGLVNRYVHNFMDDLKMRYDAHLGKGNYIKVQYYVGLLNSITIGLKKSLSCIAQGTLLPCDQSNPQGANPFCCQGLHVSSHRDCDE